MAFARLYISKLEGMEFYKLFGTGSKEGFSSNINPFSNSGIYAIMAVWENENQANIALESSKIFQNYIFKSNEHWHIFLRNISVKGKWNGKIPFKKFKDDVEGDLVVLTRATIKPRVLAKFWERVPNIQNVIGNNKDVVFKIGLAEVPFFQSVTFSIWKSETDMNEFARNRGPHCEAIKAVRKGKWFSEELYARFKIIKQIGKLEN